MKLKSIYKLLTSCEYVLFTNEKEGVCYYTNARKSFVRKLYGRLGNILQNKKLQK